MWSGLLVLHCMCMCVCVCVSMFIYAPWQCIHFLLGGEEQMNKQRAKEDRPGGFCVCVCVFVRVYQRVRGNNKSVLYVLFRSTSRVCFVVLGGRNSCWWLSRVSRDVYPPSCATHKSLPPPLSDFTPCEPITQKQHYTLQRNTQQSISLPKLLHTSLVTSTEWTFTLWVKQQLHSESWSFPLTPLYSLLTTLKSCTFKQLQYFPTLLLQ